VGAAVQVAVELALQITEKYCSISMECHTFTMPVEDMDENTNEIKTRLNSGIVIQISKKSNV
jgi:hypothetical protein